MAVVTLTTDFGLTDPFVGIMKGVLAAGAPGATVIDVSHGVPPQDVLAGALVLRAAAPYFPDGSIHVAVVDPGVGSARRAVCIVTEGDVLLGPDNGVLSLAAPPERVRAIYAVTEERFFLSPRSHTFHGRDVFAPVAAALATGTPPAALGPAIDDIVHLTVPAPETAADGTVGEVIYIDHFGNLVTNLPAALATRGLCLHYRFDTVAPLVDAYAAVPPDAPLAIVNSWNLVELAVRDGSAAERFGGRVGDPVRFARA